MAEEIEGEGQIFPEYKEPMFIYVLRKERTGFQVGGADIAAFLNKDKAMLARDTLILHGDQDYNYYLTQLRIPASY